MQVQPRQLYHQTPGKHQATGNMNGQNGLCERTSFSHGKVISDVITKASCSNTLTVRKEAFTPVLPLTNLSPTVPICLGANNLPDSSLNLSSEGDVSVLYFASLTQQDILAQTSQHCCHTENLERFLVLLCLAFFVNTGL